MLHAACEHAQLFLPQQLALAQAVYEAKNIAIKHSPVCHSSMPPWRGRSRKKFIVKIHCHCHCHCHWSTLRGTLLLVVRTCIVCIACTYVPALARATSFQYMYTYIALQASSRQERSLHALYACTDSIWQRSMHRTRTYVRQFQITSVLVQ